MPIASVAIEWMSALDPSYLDCFQIDHACDQNGPAHVRRDHCHPPPHPTAHCAVLGRSQDAEERRTGERAIEDAADEIDKTFWKPSGATHSQKKRKPV